MQFLNLEIINEAKAARMKNLDRELAGSVAGCSNREMIICPLCKYVSKRNRGSARIFQQDDGSRAFKCFSCGAWRRI